MRGETVDFPWDFARHYCDASYRPRVEAVVAAGRRALGGRIRQLREPARMTQEELAAAAGIGRGTLVRLENGGQSPRHDVGGTGRELGRAVFVVNRRSLP